MSGQLSVETNPQKFHLASCPDRVMIVFIEIFSIFPAEAEEWKGTPDSPTFPHQLNADSSNILFTA
jgi:hypothetical protein